MNRELTVLLDCWGKGWGEVHYTGWPLSSSVIGQVVYVEIDTVPRSLRQFSLDLDGCATLTLPKGFHEEGGTRVNWGPLEFLFQRTLGVSVVFSSRRRRCDWRVRVWGHLIAVRDLAGVKVEHPA